MEGGLGSGLVLELGFNTGFDFSSTIFFKIALYSDKNEQKKVEL